MAYVETLDVRSVATQMTATALPEPALDDIIERASRMFDLACGVRHEFFAAAADGAEASSRTFYGNGTNILRLDPYVPGSLNATLTYPNGYTALNFIERDGYLIQTSSDGVAAPFLRYSTGWYGGVPVTVSAIWGYESTPADVQHAIIELAINLWREIDPASLKITNLDNQPLREKLPPRVAEIARRYRFKLTEAAFV